MAKKTIVEKAKEVLSPKSKVCPNCENSGMDCSVCRKGYVI